MASPFPSDMSFEEFEKSFSETGLERLQRKARESTEHLSWQERGAIENEARKDCYLSAELHPVKPFDDAYLKQQLGEGHGA